jgi:predicted PurR-regulated permease PerM
MKSWLPRLLLTGIGVAFLAWIFAPLWLSFLISILFYLLLAPLVGVLQAKGISRNMAIFLLLAPALILLIYAAAYAIIGIRSYLPNLISDLEQLQHSATLALAGLEKDIEKLLGLRLPLAEYAQQLNLKSLVGTEKLLASTGIVLNVVINLCLVPIMLCYLLCDYSRWRDKGLNMLPNHNFELGWLLYQRISTGLQSYLRGLMFQVIILSAITSFGFWIAGFKLPILLGVLTGIAGLVPYLGPFLAMIAPIITLLSVPVFDSGALLRAVLVLLVGFGFDNVVTIPFLVAGSVDLHPLLALIVVLVAEHVGGIAGMILVIPLLGILKIVIETLIHGLGTSTARAKPQ